MIAYKILLYDNNAEAEAVMSNSFWLSANTLLNIHYFQIWAHLLYQLNRKVHIDFSEARTICYILYGDNCRDLGLKNIIYIFNTKDYREKKKKKEKSNLLFIFFYAIFYGRCRYWYVHILHFGSALDCLGRGRVRNCIYSSI